MNHTILWFSQDLRLADNPALDAAVARGGAVLPVYVWQPDAEGAWAPGAASQWWLRQSLESLDAALRTRGSRLILRAGDPAEQLARLARETQAGALVCARRYEPAAIATLARVARALGQAGIHFQAVQSGLLFDPEEIATKSGEPYKVFTPFYRACLAAIDEAPQRMAPRIDGPPPHVPARLPAPARWPQSLSFDQMPWPEKQKWLAGIKAAWRPGEAGAHERLRAFLDQPLGAYDRQRDLPAQAGTSRLSPHLHFGEISPRQVWSAVTQRVHSAQTDGARQSLRASAGRRQTAFGQPPSSDGESAPPTSSRTARADSARQSQRTSACRLQPAFRQPPSSDGGPAHPQSAKPASAGLLDGIDPSGAEAFLRQILWREFAHHLLFHFPETPLAPLRPDFARFPWDSGATAQRALQAWQQGRTGYPIVDAGMRELWATGWMHNRVRMIAASFLTKDLRIAWQDGARWFWDTLVDADLANNTFGWQWTAGCGADAAPYFRIFNPALQGARFDPDGAYIRHWVPELARLPARHIHEPWKAPAAALADAGVALGQTYPAPIVDHATARLRALAAYEAIRRMK